MAADLTITAIKTKTGYYISDEPNGDRYATTGLTRYFFDGVKSERTWHKLWVRIPSEPRKIERLVRVPNDSYRYELIDLDLPENKYPRVLDSDEVTFYDDDRDRCWKGEYAHMESLYRLAYDEHEPVMEEVPFTFNIVLELDELVDFHGTNYPVKSGHWSDIDDTRGAKDSTSQLLDRILFPTIVLPMRPCELSSKDSYDIVREHVKKTIDLRYAAIDSDYRFCFKVVKVIRLAKPITRQVEIKTARGRSYKKRRYRNIYTAGRTTTVFEMTYSPENYKGYTPIAGFRGESWQDLERVIDQYLTDLMEIINAPLIDCPHCNGMGVIETQEEQTNG